MPLQPNEIRVYKSQTISDAAPNGGRMSNVEAPSGVKNNIFPDVSLAERQAGVTRYRKVFWKIANDDDLTLFTGRVFVHLNTPGDDNVTIFPGTQRDTQADITGSERLYGAGPLNANVASGALTFVVATEGVGLNYIRTGDLIRVTDKTSAGGSGSEEFVTASNVTWAGDLATITIPSPGLANSYTAANTKVSSVYDAGDVKTSSTVPSVTSASGTLDVGTYPILGDNLATVNQDWTLTFTSATAYSIVGDTVGNVGSGNVTAGAAPGNAQFSGKPFFTLPGAAFGGTFAPGDVITFTTNPAAVPVWYKQTVPAGAVAISGDRVIVGMAGESA